MIGTVMDIDEVSRASVVRNNIIADDKLLMKSKL